MAATPMRGKIKKPLCESVQNNIVKPNIAGDLAHSYPTYLDMDKAHVLMICKQGIISKKVAKDILAVISEMSAMGDKPTFEIDPKLEGTFFNLEKYLIDHVGLETGGQLHTARSRNDLMSTIARIDIRRFYLDLCEKFIALRKTILRVAHDGTDAVMAGYTHLQPSEPITFAHYCSGILAALERDYRRLSRAFDSLNLCPMGAGSMGSTTWNIDRNFTSSILGFNAPMDNSVDAIGSRDYVMEILAAISIASNVLSRFGTDLYIWATPEFGYIEVDDSVAICSSIMPQKKNPYTLEYVRGKSGNIAGAFIGSFCAQKNTPYTNVCDVNGEGVKGIWNAMHEMKGVFELLIDTVGTVKLNKRRMLENALGNFCTVTELANSLVRHDHVSFRAAHEIVAQVVDHMLATGKKADEIRRADIDQIYQELFNSKTTMTDEQILQALDPFQNAMAKIVNGGTARPEVERQLQSRSVGIERDETELNTRLQKVAGAKERLESAVKELVQG